METYQEQRAIEPRESKNAAFATVAGVHTDGVSLLFDGESTATSKHYKVNRSASFAVNDRVYIIKTGGTYIVAFPVGNPS